MDSSHETTVEVVMATPAMYSGCSNSDASFDGYQHTGMMSGIQAVEEDEFGSMQLPKEIIADSEEEESLSSSPETSSTSNYGYIQQDLQNISNALHEMVDKEGPVVLNPDFAFCDSALHLLPHLTFSSEGFKIEHFDMASCEDDEMMTTLCWDVCDIVSIGCKWTASVESAFITLLVGSSAKATNSGPVRVEFCLTDPHWPRKQEKIWHLASRYQEIWNTPSISISEDFAPESWSIEPSLFYPKQYFFGTSDFEDIIYPKGEPDAVSISSRDVELLLPETFVNDTIIDFYIKYLSTRIETTVKRRFHFFNSFFFRKLKDLDKDQGRAPEGRTAFLRVRKWTRKIDIFAKDFLFIPVNFNLHWSLIVICHPGEVATYEDDETKVPGKVPCILHMDSLKDSHSGLKDIVQSYLWEEWKERHPESALDISDKFLNLRFVSLELPQQDNSFDCGLFLLHYVELFLMDVPSSFNPLKIDVHSSFLSDDWFVPAEASLKRSLIRKLIHELVTEPSPNFPKLACGLEQLNERHQRSEHTEQEGAREFPALGCSVGEPDTVCQIPETCQQSTSICLNDSERGLPLSGSILETGEVAMFAVQNMLVCPPDSDSVVCLPSPGAKNKSLLADLDSQLDLRSCAEALEGDGCVVKDKDTYEESVLDSLHNNQKNSSQAEVNVLGVMDSKELSLEANGNEVEDDCDDSQDMDSFMMLDASKDDIGPDAESTGGEAEHGRCDLPDVIDCVATGDINGDSEQINIAEVENGRDDMGSVAEGEMSKDVDVHSAETNVVAESEDTKHEDTRVDVRAEDATKEDDTNETSAAVNEQHVSSEPKEGRNTDSRNGTNEACADGEDDARDNLAAVPPCEDDAPCSAAAEKPHLGSGTSSAGDETVVAEGSSSSKPSDATKRALPDKCSQDDAAAAEECGEAKLQEHYYKRRKVSAPEE